MSERILGLVGSGKGPFISTKVLGSRVAARVTGLKKGSVTVEVSETIEHGTSELHHLAENGIHEIKPGSYMRVFCDDGNPSMICTLLRRAV
jgi:hypothetical protein